MPSITSIVLPPKPPWASANGRPSRPISAMAAHTSVLQPPGEPMILARASKLEWVATKRLIVSASSVCSSLSSKFIAWSPRSQAERHLADDVALDLVRPRVDRGLAQVAVARGQCRGEAIEGGIGLDRPEGLGERAGGLHHQLGERLLDLRALDLEQRPLRARRLVAAPQLIEEAQIGDLQRHQLDLDAGEAVPEAGVGAQG